MTLPDPRFDFVSPATVIVRNPPPRKNLGACGGCRRRFPRVLLTKIALPRCPMNGADTNYDVLKEEGWVPMFGVYLCSACLEHL